MFSNYIKEISKKIINTDINNISNTSIYSYKDVNQKNIKDIYEILIGITFECYDIKYNSIFNLENFNDMNKYYNKLGFNVILEKINKDDKYYNKTMNNFFNKIIFKNDPSWNMYFTINNKDNHNYMIINGTNSPYNLNKNCDFNNLYSLIDMNYNKELYKLSIKLLN